MAEPVQVTSKNVSVPVVFMVIRVHLVPEYFGAVPLAPLESATDYHLVARVTHLFQHVCEIIAAQVVFVFFMPLLGNCAFEHIFFITTKLLSVFLYSIE